MTDLGVLLEDERYVMFLIRSGAIEGFEKLVSQLGKNPVEILHQAGFSPAQLRQPNTYLAYPNLATLLDISAHLCQEPRFGLRLAVGQNQLVFGELALSSHQQPSLGEALAFAGQHLHLHAHGSRLIKHHHDDQVEFHIDFDFSSPMGLVQLMQLSCAQLHSAVRYLAGNTSPQLQLHLQQAKPTAGSWSGGDQPIFNSHMNGVRFPASWLVLKPRPDETLIREYFQQRIQYLEAHYPNNLQAQVRDVINSLLPSGECTVSRVSAALGLHSRALQRRLKLQGSSFNTLLQDTRLEISQQYLQCSRLSITELALNLGYADIAVFSRKFKCWTGYSPRQWRELQRTERIDNKSQWV